MAMKMGAPVIGLVDCAGLRLQEATDAQMCIRDRLMGIKDEFYNYYQELPEDAGCLRACLLYTSWLMVPSRKVSRQLEMPGSIWSRGCRILSANQDSHVTSRRSTSKTES